MQPTLSPQDFVDKWRHATLKERSACQEHFIDLCRLVGHSTPAEADPKGEWFTFEAGATKTSGGQGYADVWKKGYFAWEYKGKHADLDKAYQQLLQYHEALQNPPLLVVSDIDRIRVHTRFVNTVKQVYEITLDDLLTPEGWRLLHSVFYEPQSFKSPQTTEQVTEAAARELVEKRDAWLNPPGASQAELKKRTLTNLYNQRPTWLDLAHRKLDEAVLDAYGWPHELSDEEILERLLALNLERAAVEV
jgi:type II restriction/modification system DNA methylase subunit YeeA